MWTNDEPRRNFQTSITVWTEMESNCQFPSSLYFTTAGGSVEGSALFFRRLGHIQIILSWKSIECLIMLLRWFWKCFFGLDIEETLAYENYTMKNLNFGSQYVNLWINSLSLRFQNNSVMPKLCTSFPQKIYLIWFCSNWIKSHLIKIRQV